MDTNGVVLPSGSADPHYTLATNPNGASTTVWVVTPLPGGWLTNTAISQWIGPMINGAGVEGTYNYQITFDVPCTNNAVVTGRWAVDNNGAILLNGSPTPVATLTGGGSGNFTTWHPFTITSGLVAGLNVLDFSVTNSGGPTGLRVELMGSATCCCPPTNTVILNTGYDHTQGTVYPISPVAADAFWKVVGDPDSGTTEPRQSTVIAPNPAWAAAQPNSQWISSYPTADDDLNGPYDFQTQFCLESNYTNIVLSICLRADDWAEVFLNGDPNLNLNKILQAGDATDSVFYESPRVNPICTTIDSDSPPYSALFHPGPNYLLVRVHNQYNVAMGLNLTGSVTGSGLMLEKPECCQPGSGISGQKFYDLNNNGVRDPGEPALQGWTVHLSNGANAVTDINGYYYFLNLVPGTYTVTEVAQSGWTQTAPAGGSYTVTLGVAQEVNGRDFGNWRSNPNPNCIRITCPGDLTNECTGFGAIVSYAMTATNLCSTNPPTIYCTPASTSLFPLGTTTVHCTAYDTNTGNYATCSFNVTVQDTIPPIVSTICMTNVFFAGGSNNFTTPVPSSPSAGLLTRLTNAGVSSFKKFDQCAVDSYLAHTFTNLPGCITAATLTMRLKPCGGNCENDAVNLSFTSTGGTLLTTDGNWTSYLGSGNASAGLETNDWCNYTSGAVITLDLANLPASGLNLLPFLNQYGFLDFTEQDDTGVDYLQLTIVSCCCSTNKTVECGSNWDFDPPSAVDACSGTPVPITSFSTVTNGLCPKALVRTWLFTDASGNTSMCSQTVTVVDTTPPTIICYPHTAVPLTNCQLVIPLIKVAATDNCTPASRLVYTQSPAAGTIVSGRSQQVTVTVTDACGLSNSCEVTVFGLPETGPVVVCPTNVVATNCLVPCVLSSVTATSTCCATSSLTITQNPPCGDLIGSGVNSIAVTVTDCNGNSTTKVVSLTVGGSGSFLSALFNTGVGGSSGPSGPLLADNTVDPHYALTSVPKGMPIDYSIGNAVAVSDICHLKNPGGCGYGLSSSCYLWTPWSLAPDHSASVSKWIGPDYTNNGCNPGGYYTYTMTFNLPASLDPKAATISGRWAADNAALMYLNSGVVPVGATQNGDAGFKQWTPFTIPAGSPFMSGPNTLTFLVTNVDQWTGLRVEFTNAFSGCATCAPPTIISMTGAAFWAAAWGTGQATAPAAAGQHTYAQC